MAEKIIKKRSPKDPSEWQVCLKCKKDKKLFSDYYSTESELYTETKKYPVCKSCLTSTLPQQDVNNPLYMDAIKNLLRELNKPFLATTWQVSIEEAQRRNWNVFSSYMKNLALLSKSATSKETESIAVVTPLKVEIEPQERIETEPTIDDKKNEHDVIRMLGYDPFEYESVHDRKNLYNKLVDFLDESTLEDSFKLPTVIEIVISFNQIDKINSAISKITSSAETLASEVGKVQSLITAKEKMLKSVLALAKDNGISVNHNNNKSKGGGTLSGIIKTLQEKGFTEGDINLFDIETSEGMRQVADLSNENIKKQLMFDENDYTNMLIEQRDLIQELTDKVEVLQETNRKLRLQLKTDSEVTYE